MQTIRMTAQDFKERVFNYEKESEWKYAGELPAIIDFYADWCGPCKMIAPILDDLAGQYEGKLKIAKVDVDANKETPGKFNIRGIPTLIIFKDGNVEATKVGALSRTQLIDFIDSVV